MSLADGLVSVLREALLPWVAEPSGEAVEVAADEDGVPFADGELDAACDA